MFQILERVKVFDRVQSAFDKCLTVPTLDLTSGLQIYVEMHKYPVGNTSREIYQIKNDGEICGI